MEWMSSRSSWYRGFGLRKGPERPPERLGQVGPSLAAAGVLVNKEIGQAHAGDRREAAIGGNANDRQGDAERDDLKIANSARASPGYSTGAHQPRDKAEVQDVEVGVHHESRSTVALGASTSPPYLSPLCSRLLP